MNIKKLILAVSLVLVSLSFLFVASSFAVQPTDKGFDEFGYNNIARIFNGSLSGWCNKYYNNNDGCIDTIYQPWANDHLTMKWNSAWDACNEAGNFNASVCTGAWTDNEWNGMNGGSGSVWHYKIVWNGDCSLPGTSLPDGGICLWGPYEQLMSQGVDSGVHYWENKAVPNGYGVMP